MSLPDTRVLLGRIGATYGVRGEVRVKAFTVDPTSLAGYGPLLSNDGRVFIVERLRPAREVVIAKFKGIDDRDAAASLKGTELYVERDRLPVPADEEFYHADLIGLAATGVRGEPLGTIVAVQNFGAGDILEITPERGPSLLVPFTKEAVPDIDVAAGRAIVALPQDADDDEPQSNQEGEP